MKYRSHCPIARTLDVLGDRWTLVVMRDALLLGCRTFAEFESGKENIPTNQLSDRLKRLVELGLLEKVAYQQHPARFKYVPTEQGEAVRPILKSLREFGEEYLDGKVSI
ncbi:MAG: helix-turn-helix domain-containing protein [Pseudomonadota bacterium]